MSDSLNIGVILPNDLIKRLPFGGASGFIQNLIPHFRYNMTIFGVGANGTMVNQPHRLGKRTVFQPVYPVEFPARRPLRLQAVAGYWRCRKQILDSGVDLLYVHSPECALPFLFNRRGIPLVFHQHGSGNPVETAVFPWARNRVVKMVFNGIHRLIYTHADWIIAIDRICAAQAVGGGGRGRLTTIMNAVDMETFYPNGDLGRSMRHKYGIEDEKVVFFAGRLEELKQVDRLMDSLSRQTTGKRVRLFLAGDGSQRGELEARSRDLGLEDQVTFLGKVPHDQLPGFYNMADVLALPSRMEGVPMVILEALACGKPVLASAVGGIPELIRPNENGILMSPADPAALDRGLETVLSRTWAPEIIRNHAAPWGAAQVAQTLCNLFSTLVKTP